MTHEIRKVAWLHIEDGRILAVRSIGNVQFYLPGGKPEPGEDEITTLCREILEEVSVEIVRSSARKFGTFRAQADGKPPGTTVIASCYTASYQGEASVSSEIAELRWLGVQDWEQLTPVGILAAQAAQRRAIFQTNC